MKIKTVDEKPVVIHRKRKTKLHLHKGGKAVLHKKAANTVQISKKPDRKVGKRAEGNKGKEWKERAGSSIKVRSQRLRTFASAGAGYGIRQVEGGEEAAESADVMLAVSSPAVGAASKVTALYRKRMAEKKGKGRKSRVQTEPLHTVDSMPAKRKRAGGKSGRKDTEKGKSREKGVFGAGSFVKSRMIESFLDKFQTDKEDGQGGLVEGTAGTAKAAALLMAKQAAAFLAPVFLLLFAVAAVVGIIVVAILAVIYHSPLSIFFPLPDTGYDNPRTVLCEYYKEFNQNIISLENNGYVITYQNSEDGIPVSNFNDTLMVYMVKYGTGQAAYVMDGEGKKHLKEVFDEMNYCDNSSGKTQIPAGASLGEVVTTGYCNCSLCCGKWAGGHTASGTVPKADHTLAVDAHSPKVPMGTKIVMNGKTYKVEDTGNFARYGTDFDIYFDSHEAALAWGKRKVEAFLADGDENTVEVTVSGTLVHNLTYKDYMALDKLSEEQKDWLESMMGDEMQENYTTGSGGQAVADLAMTKIGCRYSQDKRYEEGWYDCSSLVQRLYKEVGINLPATAAAQGEYCYKNAMLINKKQLKPGDLIFYSYKENGEFRNISHVAIYVGDGKMVHAANPSRGVVIDPLRTNSVVFYARPY
ncbi:MAG: NlpC/P60 family protein [Clostridium sp.]|nr:NlpC/P60 family protein [Clostridium sp.]